ILEFSDWFDWGDWGDFANAIGVNRTLKINKKPKIRHTIPLHFILFKLKLTFFYLTLRPITGTTTLINAVF
ncbi:MAG TPA: hypothetical protein VMW66_01000, partial [Elusimicrobiales bacterium]|nr:hypothetical protein [Elusimicrobiales bacterium]